MPDKGLPIRIDSNAKSASQDAPAFVAAPEGSPVYYGFPILEDVCVEDFKFGMITDFEAEETNWGDAFVLAPDGSRAGLVWEIRSDDFFAEILPASADRWGVYETAFSGPMRNRDDARRNLALILPRLKERWETWKKQQPR